MTKMDRLERALAYRTGKPSPDNYLFDKGDVVDIIERPDGSVELDLSLASEWVDEYRFTGLIHEFGPLRSCEQYASGCDTCGYGCAYTAVLGPKDSE